MQQTPQARKPIAKPLPSATVFASAKTARGPSPMARVLRTVVPVAVILFAFALLGLVYTRAPYAAFCGLCSALERRDRAALSRYVDFASLRDSVGAVVAEAARQRQKAATGTDREAALLAELGVGVMAATLGEVIVSPAGLAALTRGDIPDLLAADSSDHSADTRPVKRRMRHESGGRFVVTCCREGAPGRDLVFRRAGLLSWKLVAIR